MAKDRIISGLDIGSSKVTAIIASVLGEKINILGVAQNESRGIKKGQVVDIEEAVSAIGGCFDAAERMAGVAIGSALIAVGGGHIACQNSKGVVAVSDPQGEIKEQDDITRVIEAARAVSLPSSREIIHCIPRSFTVDNQAGISDPTGMTGVRLEIETHIITGSSTAMRNLAKCVADVGIEIEGLVFSGLAASYAVLSETEKELGVVLVDIGGGTTSICVYSDGSLIHSAVIPVGAKNITNDIAIGLRVSLETAEKIKLSLVKKQKTAVLPEGIKDETKEDQDEINLTGLGAAEEIKKVSRKTLTEGIIRPRLSEIFSLVGMELKGSGLGAATPAGVVLTGGGAETVLALETCRRTLALPVRLGTCEGKVTGLIDEILTPAFAVPVGLILFGLKETETKYASGFPFFGKTIAKPMRGIWQKGMEMIKSFLP
ncbi:MAG: cell division protein FtsA [bacterium]|nr:cell division protein FtsA [bacterium]